MRCAACGRENSEENRFCEACGAPLTAPCPTCGHDNRSSARFCGGCGAPLRSPEAGTDAEAGRSKDRAAALPTGDRRPVAILFADLAGFTRISSQRDPEETHGILKRFFETVDGIIEGYGGAIDKHIGDCAMAVFGAPIAHGNDPERAVRAAADVQGAMRELSDAIGIPLKVHVGVAAGEVIASGTGSSRHEEYTVTGDSVNLAARLQDIAGPGETLLTDLVYRSTAPLVRAEPLGEVAVEGFPEPVRVWRMQGLRAHALTPEHSAFVGRRSELAQFAGILEACKASGTGKAVYLRGEAGIGKTRLVMEFAAAAGARGFGCHRGLVFDFGVEKGQDAIRAIVHSLLGLAPNAGGRERQAAADRAVSGGLVAAENLVFLSDLLDLPQPTEHRALYEAMENATRNRGKQALVARLVEATSRTRPALVVIENLHWAEPTMLAYLAALATIVEDCAALLVLTSRLDGDPLDRIRRGAAHGSSLVTIDLGPLRRQEAKALAEEFTTLEATNSQLARRCIERAEGNPLFLEQLLHGAERGGFTEVPASIQGIVLARLDQLSGRDKNALLAASVVGQRFALASLRHLMDDPRYEPQGLLAHHLVQPQGEGWFLFAHALIQESVYQSLLKARRRQLHGRAAAWFAERDPVVHAQHLDRADDPAAAGAYLAASRAQAAGLHYERARSLVERGLAVATARSDKYALMCLQGELLHDLGPVEASIEAYRQGLDFAGSDVDRCRAWLGLAEGMRVTDAFDEAFTALDEAEAAAVRDDLVLERARIHNLRGNLCFPLGRTAECKKQHTLSLRYAKRAHSAEAEARALSGLGDAEFGLGRMQTSHKHFRRCLDLCREHDFERIEVANRSMFGFTWLFLNDAKQALADCMAAVDAAVRLGHARAELTGLNISCNVLYEMADFPRLQDHVERAQALVRRLGAWRFEAQNLLFLARVLHAEGEPAKAVDLAKEAWRISRETSVGFTGPRVLGTLALVAKDPAERQEALAEGERILGAGAILYNHFGFSRDAIEVNLEAGDWDAVDRHAAALEDYTRAEPLPWTDLVIARARALAAHGRGRRDDRTIGALRDVREEARRAALYLSVPALDAALEGSE